MVTVTTFFHKAGKYDSGKRKSVTEEKNLQSRMMSATQPLLVGFHSNPNKAHLIQQLEQGCPTLFLEIYHPVGFHSNPNKAHLIQQLEQGCPTLFLEIYHPVGFHSNPNKAHLIQQLEQGCPTLFLELYHPVGFHSNPNKATPHSTARAGLPNPVPGDLPSCRVSLQPQQSKKNVWETIKLCTRPQCSTM